METAILVALIAFASGIFVAALNSVFNSRNQRKKEVGAAVAELMKSITAINLEIVWLRWDAKFQPEAIDTIKTAIAGYNQTTKALDVDLAGYRVVVAALSSRIHRKLTPFIDRLYQLDEIVNQAFVSFHNSPTQGIAALAACYDQATAVNDELSQAVSNIISES